LGFKCGELYGCGACCWTWLSGVKAEGGRGEISELSIDGKSITLIDEAYNANPTSMTAAIKLLGLKSGRRLAVLGDMAELGKDELAMHAGLSSARA